MSLGLRLRQFSATFSNRAPPLELRMLLPELEAVIGFNEASTISSALYPEPTPLDDAVNVCLK